MKIRRLYPNEVPRELLLLADESEGALADYVDRGECYGAIEDGVVIGEYVLIHTRPFTAEIVNIAVDPAHQGHGIGCRLIGHAIETARSKGFRKLEIGTGDIGYIQLALYKKCGFREEWRDRDFFVKHCPEPIYENGEQLRDMVRLGMDL